MAGEWKCRYCVHLVDVRPPGTRYYIGACEFRLDPETCDKFVDIRLAEAGERYRPRYEVTKDHR